MTCSLVAHAFGSFVGAVVGVVTALWIVRKIKERRARDRARESFEAS